jgi:hypothetical protein
MTEPSAYLDAAICTRHSDPNETPRLHRGASQSDDGNLRQDDPAMRRLTHCACRSRSSRSSVSVRGFPVSHEGPVYEPRVTLAESWPSVRRTILMDAPAEMASDVV